MDITWHGNQTFKFKGKKATVLINPEDDKLINKADVVLNSTGKEVTAEEPTQVIDWPGEYEVNEIPVVGFQTWNDEAKKEENIIFFFKIDGVKCCHLGSLGTMPTNDTINKIGDIDILMIDAGSSTKLSQKKAVELIEAIEPKALIPMGDGNFTTLLKELSAGDVKSEPKVEVNGSSSLPNDKLSFFVLEQS